jgi:hypothetical protein
MKSVYARCLLVFSTKKICCQTVQVTCWNRNEITVSIYANNKGFSALLIGISYQNRNNLCLPVVCLNCEKQQKLKTFKDKSQKNQLVHLTMMPCLGKKIKLLSPPQFRLRTDWIFPAFLTFIWIHWMFASMSYMGKVQGVPNGNGGRHSQKW